MRLAAIVGTLIDKWNTALLRMTVPGVGLNSAVPVSGKALAAGFLQVNYPRLAPYGSQFLQYQEQTPGRRKGIFFWSNTRILGMPWRILKCIDSYATD